MGRLLDYAQEQEKKEEERLLRRGDLLRAAKEIQTAVTEHPTTGTSFFNVLPEGPAEPEPEPISGKPSPKIFGTEPTIPVETKTLEDVKPIYDQLPVPEPFKPEPFAIDDTVAAQRLLDDIRKKEQESLPPPTQQELNSIAVRSGARPYVNLALKNIPAPSDMIDAQNINKIYPDVSPLTQALAGKTPLMQPQELPQPDIRLPMPDQLDFRPGGSMVPEDYQVAAEEATQALLPRMTRTQQFIYNQLPEAGTTLPLYVGAGKLAEAIPAAATASRYLSTLPRSAVTFAAGGAATAPKGYEAQGALSGLMTAPFIHAPLSTSVAKSRLLDVPFRAKMAGTMMAGPAYIQDAMTGELRPETIDADVMGSLIGLTGAFGGRGEIKPRRVPSSPDFVMGKTLPSPQRGPIEMLGSRPKPLLVGGESVKSGRTQPKRPQASTPDITEKVSETETVVQPPQKQSKQPWEMTRSEFEKEFLFHGKGEGHPTYGQEKITGGATQSYKLASGYAKGGEGGKGEVHLVRKSELPEGPRKDLEDTGVISGMGLVPTKSSGVLPIDLTDPYRYIVEQAIQRGESVPENVLSELRSPKPVNIFGTESAIRAEAAPSMGGQEIVDPGTGKGLSTARAGQIEGVVPEVGGQAWTITQPPYRGGEVDVSGKRPKSAILDKIVRWSRGEPVEITPSDALKWVLRRESVASKEGYREGRRGRSEEVSRAFRNGEISMQMTHQELMDYAKEHLPSGDYKLLAKAGESISKTRTLGEQKRFVRLIDRMLMQHEHRQAIDSLKKTVADFNGKRDKMPDSIQEAVDSLMEDVALKKPSKKTIRRSEATLEAANRELAEDGLITIHEDILKRAEQALSDSRKTGVRELTADQIHDLDTAIKHIVGQQERKGKLLGAQRGKETAEVVKNTSAEIAKLHGEKNKQSVTNRQTNLRPTVLQRMWTGVKSLWPTTDMTKIMFLLGENGVGADIFRWNIRDAWTNNKARLIEFYRWRKQTMDKLGISDEKLRTISDDFERSAGKSQVQNAKVTLPEAVDQHGARVKEIDITLGQLVSLNGLMMDPSAKAKLLRDSRNGLVLPLSPKTTIRFSRSDLLSILEQTPPEIKALAKEMFDYYNGIARANKDATTMNVLGYTLTRDNFWPTKTFEENETPRVGKGFQHHIDTHIEDNPNLIRRVQHGKPLVLEDAFTVMRERVWRDELFNTMAESTMNARRVLKTQSFRDQVRDAFGVREGNKLLRKLEDMVEKYEGTGLREGWSPIEKGVLGLTKNVQSGYLKLKPWISWYQRVGVVNGSYHPDLHLNDLQKSVRMGKERHAEINKILTDPNSPGYSPDYTMRVQHESGHSHVTSIASNRVPDPFSFWGLKSDPWYKSLDALTKTDALSLRQTYDSLLREYERQGLSGDELYRKATKTLRTIVDESQATNDPMTSPSILTERPVAKMLWGMFSSQSSKLGDMAARAKIYASRGEYKKAARIAGVLIADAVLIEAVRRAATETIRRATNKIAGKKDEERDKPSSVASHFAWGVFENAAGNVPVIGPLAALGVKSVVNGIFGDSLPPEQNQAIIFDIIENFAKTAYYGTRSIAELVSGEEYDTGKFSGESKAKIDASRAFESAMRSLPAFGVPSSAVNVYLRQFYPHVRPERKKTSSSVPKYNLPSPGSYGSRRYGN